MSPNPSYLPSNSNLTPNFRLRSSPYIVTARLVTVNRIPLGPTMLGIWENRWTLYVYENLVDPCQIIEYVRISIYIFTWY